MPSVKKIEVEEFLNTDGHKLAEVTRTDAP